MGSIYYTFPVEHPIYDQVSRPLAKAEVNAESCRQLLYLHWLNRPTILTWITTIRRNVPTSIKLTLYRGLCADAFISLINLITRFFRMAVSEPAWPTSVGGVRNYQLSFPLTLPPPSALTLFPPPSIHRHGALPIPHTLSCLHLFHRSRSAQNRAPWSFPLQVRRQITFLH